MEKVKDSWNANLYDGKHSFVSMYGESLFELLAPQKGEKILDLGCGTGDLAKQLSEYGAEMTGVDKSEKMIEQARNKYPDIKFIVQDATELEFHHEFDAVFSNAALHWIKQPREALTCIYNCLKQGGRFVAEFGGKGNIRSISDEIINQIEAENLPFNIKKFPWFFPSIAEYTSLMEQAGFRVTFAQHVDRPTPLEGKSGVTNWIHMFGGSMLDGFSDDQKHRIIAKVEDNLRKVIFKDGNWVADYKRIRVIGIKE
ncbi:class I SAM-dependent methyltransferase [Neobacillus cucumis]|uniref:SAM-dependent methyltransferase n=1 Tax=Neobacillus cucumis TaxID=1740721 RepID=A0A2N5HE02_9BACI|nr:class I SAM-dependent methyltransferase [Neobacillus cucumis]PLS03766.1 SAM-dependent methyltransferase [Neobacillus cucumis]